MTTPMPHAVKIAGMGHYLPERRVTSAELEDQLGLKPGWVVRATGVRERRRASPQETASWMAARAAKQALAAAGLELEEIDLIVGASSGPEQLIPCTAALVQRELGAPEGRSLCFDINATCLSFTVGMHMLAPMIAAGVYRNVLLFSSEITAHSLNPNEPESAVLLGDASVAAILTRTPQGESSCLHGARFTTHSSGADMTYFSGGGNRHHPNDPLTTPEMNLFAMHGPSVFRMASRILPPFVEEFFAAVGWEPGMIDAVVPHQASGHALTFIGSRLGFQPEQIVTNLAERGNCIAASLPLALSEAVESGRVRRGDKLALVGTGAGLTLGVAALTF